MLERAFWLSLVNGRDRWPKAQATGERVIDVETPPRYSRQCIVMIAAMISMPSQRFCSRRFSFSACWLLS